MEAYACLKYLACSSTNDQRELNIFQDNANCCEYCPGKRSSPCCLLEEENWEIEQSEG